VGLGSEVPQKLNDNCYAIAVGQIPVKLSGDAVNSFCMLLVM